MSSTPRSVIFSSREVIEICKIMANALENDTDRAALLGDSGDEESFDGFGEGGSSSDDDLYLDFKGLDTEEDQEDAVDQEEA